VFFSCQECQVAKTVKSRECPGGKTANQLWQWEKIDPSHKGQSFNPVAKRSIINTRGTTTQYGQNECVRLKAEYMGSQFVCKFAITIDSTLIPGYLYV